ncbi:MAG: hypothetical protein DRJ10_08300, partial [Bacteroidetes bacterium]
ATKEEIEKYSHVFDEYLTKPITEKVLIKTIAKYLDHKEKKNEAKVEIEGQNCIWELQKQKSEIETFPKELKTILNEELKPLHKELLEVLSVDRLKYFAERNKNLAEKNDVKGLVKYSEEILTLIINFDITRIKKTLNYYPEIIKIICE